MGCSYQDWTDVCHSFQNLVGSMFERWAKFTYHHPKAVICVSLLLSFILIGGFYRFNMYGQSERIFYPQDSEIFHNLNRARKSFDYYVQYEEFILVQNVDRSNDGNVSLINEIAFSLALDIHRGIMKLTGFDDFCIFSKIGICSVVSPLEIFHFDSRRLLNIRSKLISVYLNQSYVMSNGQSPFTSYPQMFGNFELNATLNTFKTDVLRTSYPVKFAQTRKQYERNKQWEKKLNNYLSSWKPLVAKQGLKLVFNTVGSMDDSVERTTIDNLLLVTVSIGAMVVFCALCMSHFKNWISGHVLLSLVGVGAVTLGIGAAFGLTLYTGVPYVGFIGVLPFLTLGVGIDDIFIIINKVDMLSNQYKGSTLIGNVMKQVGFTITMTTVTDVVAFIVGTVSNIPAIQIFCIYAFLSILFSYLLINTFFLAMVSYDIKRIEDNRIDLVPCFHGSDVTAVEESNKSELLSNDQKLGCSARVLLHYARTLMKPVGKAAAIVFAALLLAMGIYGTLHTDLNFDYKLLGAKGSNYLTWMEMMEEKFPIGTFPIDVMLDEPSIDYNSTKVQNMFYKLNDIILQNNFFDNVTINWMTSYLEWCQSSNTTEGFYGSLHKFLSIHRNFKNDIVMDSNKKIIASRIHVFTKNSMNWLFRRDALVSLNKELKEVEPFYTVSFQLIYLSQLVTIVWSTSLNILICCLVILLIMLPFIINPVVSILFLITFICFIVELLGVMYLWGLSLNSITMIVMVMAVGFTIDYSCHITHTYLTSEKNSPEERIEVAIQTMGGSVLKGGLSTLIGIIVLSISSSKLFILFFKMMFTIIVLGLVHGMVILPVLLTFFCRSRLTSLKPDCKGNNDTRIDAAHQEEIAMLKLTT